MARCARTQHLEDILLLNNNDILDLSYKTYEIKHSHDVGTYKPSKTGIEFHSDNVSDVKLALGPYGSGKTSMILMDSIFKACAMPPCNDGIRRSRVIVVRNTFDQLKKGVFDLWMTWCSKLGKVNYTTGNQLYAHHLFNDGYGLVDMELWFLPVRSTDDADKLKSFNATFAILNELSTLPRLIFKDVAARLGRYPKKDTIDSRYIRSANKDIPYWYGIIADTNPPNTRHFIYDIFEKELPNGFRIFKQPPGLLEEEEKKILMDPKGNYIANKEADNYGIGIPSDYYPKLAQGATQEYINVYCMGRYGTLSEGKPVYPSYNDDLHSVEDIEIDKDESILLTLDGGFTPAALISQFINGRLDYVKEFTTERMYLEELIEQVVKPYIAATYRDVLIEGWVGDPAITQREVEALKRLGISLKKANTNEIAPRVQAQVSFLNKMVDGQPALRVSKKGCPVLRAGFIGEYKFRKLKTIEEKIADIPEKLHPVSDIHDCGQYASLHFISNMVRKENRVDSKIFINTEQF